MRHPAKNVVLSRRRLMAAFVGAACLASAGVHAQAPSYPTKPVRFVVPFAPGGPTDALARNLAAKMGELLGKPVIVDNRPGASGTIGVAAVAHAPADGYTLLFHEVAATFAIQPVITKALTYDVRKDFTPISLAASGPIFLVVNSTVPVRNVKELIELAKKKPGDVSFASSGGVGQLPTHIGPELLKMKHGLDLNHIPYKGAGPAMVDIAAGRVSMIMTTGLGSVQQFIDSGKVKALAITGDKRADALPNVPTFAEEGVPLPELSGGTMWGLLGPAGLPRDIVVKLNQAVVKAMASPEVREKLTALNIEPRTSSPEAFSELIKKETETWGGVLKRMNIQVD